MPKEVQIRGPQPGPPTIYPLFNGGNPVTNTVFETQNLTGQAVVVYGTTSGSAGGTISIGPIQGSEIGVFLAGPAGTRWTVILPAFWWIKLQSTNGSVTVTGVIGLSV